ncbi:DUF6265 family protein [Rivibacter subsaxonicus]|uniref:DUF6265 domain-containing protein n=1 Tax=Rivibacter subsaxonicus TaxID=457575 RepID=A0A4Q7VH33_9BURK|nr:DUF6265 family protein [Rivibacter subsaxonicus]RZT95371.1 hypothetical protein EV670_3126 [Rivibacter subsaxonicus]
MKHAFACVFAVLALAVDAGAAPIDQMTWLAGCWQSESGSGERQIDEQWMAPLGGAMLGSGRTVGGGRLLEYEQMLIRDDDGVLVYTAKPSRQPQASFKSIEIGDGVAVFENKAHDFPQRVIYRRAGDGGLAARIEWQLRGQPRAIDFNFRRVACPGQP